MFCPKCGAESPDGLRFCGNCGNELNVDVKQKEPRPEANVKAIVSFWLMIMSAPVLLILCLISQEKGTGFGWAPYTYTYIPGNLQVVFVIITLIMLIASIVLKITSNLHSKKFNVIMIIGYIVSIVASFFIMVFQFPL